MNFSKFCKIKESKDPETGKPMGGNSPNANRDLPNNGNLGYGEKQIYSTEFDKAIDTANEFSQALEKLKGIINKKENSVIDIDNTVLKIKEICNQLKTVADQFDRPNSNL